MHSSPELDDDDEMFPDEADGPSTPTHAPSFQHPLSELSPPNSQGPAPLRGGGANVSDFATNNTPSNTLNENGKRVLTITPSSGISKFATTGTGEHVHKTTGYTWDKAEDEPGYAWMNKRAQEEAHRAWDSIVDKGAMIKSAYFRLLG